MPDSTQVFPPGFRITDANGDPVSGAKLNFYNAGTTDQQTVYSDSGLATALPNPVVCDSAGAPTSDGNSVTQIYVGTAAYKVVITDSSDVTLATFDQIKGAIDTSGFSGSGSGVYSRPVSSVTSDYSVVAGDAGKIFHGNPTGATFTLTLPDAVTSGNGFAIGVRHDGTSNQIRIATVSSQTIDVPGANAANGYSLAALGHWVELVSDGSNWIANVVSPPLIASDRASITINDFLTAPPTSPDAGARYIIEGTPTGDWASFSEHDVVEADGQGGWIKYTPPTDSGWEIYLQDGNLKYRFEASAWVLLNDKPGSNNDLAYYHAEHTAASGTDGGNTVTGIWNSRTLSEVGGTITSAAISSGNVSLAAGSYAVWISGQAYSAIASDVVHRFKSTTTTKEVRTVNSLTNSSGATTSGFGLLELTEAEVFEAATYPTQGQNTVGLGRAASISGYTERYFDVYIIDLAGLRGLTGAQGAQGSTGADGADAGFSFTWNLDTSETDPGSGQVKGDNATLASITELYISETDADSAALAAEIATWDDSTSSTRAKVKVQGSAGMILFEVTGANTDHGSWVTLTGSVVASRGSLSGAVSVLNVPTGDQGATGSTGSTGDTGSTGATGATGPNTGLDYAWTASTSGDPGSGNVGANDTTLASATEINISTTGANSESLGPVIATWDDTTNTSHLGHLRIFTVADRTEFIEAEITAIADNTSYYTLTVTMTATSGAPSASDVMAVMFERTGDKGADGAGAGDVTAASAFATDNRVVTSDGVAKGVQASAVSIDDSGNVSGAGNISLSGTVDGRDVDADGTKLDGIEDNATADQTAADIRGLGFFDTTNDGSGSGLDADTLDGVEGSGYATSVHNHSGIYEPIDAEIVRADTDDNLTAGYTATADDDGTQSSGTYTPAPAGGNLKRIVNGGAFTLAAPTATGDYQIVLQLTNNASAGAVTFSGFDQNDGDSLDTTDGNDFMLFITKINSLIYLHTKALQ